jgi:hypothetical protein
MFAAGDGPTLVGVTRSGASVTFYRNGTQLGAVQTSANNAGIRMADQAAIVLGDTHANNGAVVGTNLDGQYLLAAIYSRALSATEMRQIARDPFALVRRPLVPVRVASPQLHLLGTRVGNLRRARGRPSAIAKPTPAMTARTNDARTTKPEFVPFLRNLQAAWLFNEGSGTTVHDWTGRGNDITASGGFAGLNEGWTRRAVGPNVLLSGTSYFNTGKKTFGNCNFFADSSHQWTAVIRFRSSDTVSTTTLMARASATNANRTFQLYLDGASGVPGIILRGTVTALSIGLQDTQFHTHIIRWDGTTATYSRDGLRNKTTLSVGTAVEETSENFLIGGRTGSAPAILALGNIQYVLAWDRALTDGEVSEYFSSIQSGTTGGPDGDGRLYSAFLHRRRIPLSTGGVAGTTRTATVTANGVVSPPVLVHTATTTFGALLRLTGLRLVQMAAFKTGTLAGLVRRPRARVAGNRKPQPRPVPPAQVPSQWRETRRGMVFGSLLGGAGTRDLITGTVGQLMGAGTWRGTSKLGPVFSSPGGTADGVAFARTIPGTAAFTAALTGTRFSLFLEAGITAISENGCLVNIPYTNSTTDYLAPYDLVSFGRSGTTSSAYLGVVDDLSTRFVAVSDSGYFDTLTGSARSYAVTRDGDTVRFYRDGLQYGAPQTLVSTVDTGRDSGFAPSPEPTVDNGADLSLFNRSRYYPGQAVTGQIAAFYAWDRAVGPAEIQALQQDAFGPFRIATRRSPLALLSPNGTRLIAFGASAVLRRASVLKTTTASAVAQVRNRTAAVSLAGRTIATALHQATITIAARLTHRAVESWGYNATLSRTRPRSVDVQGHLSHPGIARAWSAVAVLVRRTVRTWTAAAVVKRLAIQRLVTFAATLRQHRTRAVVVAAVAKRFARTTTMAVAARVVRVVPRSLATAAVLRRARSTATTIAAVRKRLGAPRLVLASTVVGAPHLFRVAAVLRRTRTAGTTASARLYQRLVRTWTASAVKTRRLTNTVALGAMIERTRAKAVVIGAVTRKVVARTVAIAAYVPRRLTRTVAAAASLKRFAATHIARMTAALRRAGVTATPRASAVIGPPHLFRAAAVLRRAVVRTTTVSARLFRRSVATTVARAVLRRTVRPGLAVAALTEKGRSRLVSMAGDVRRAGVTRSVVAVARVVTVRTRAVAMATYLARYKNLRSVSAQAVLKGVARRVTAIAAVLRPPSRIQVSAALRRTRTASFVIAAIARQRRTATVAQAALLKRTGRLITLGIAALTRRATHDTVVIAAIAKRFGALRTFALGARVVTIRTRPSTVAAVLRKARVGVTLGGAAVLKRLGRGMSLFASARVRGPLTTVVGALVRRTRIATAATTAYLYVRRTRTAVLAGVLTHRITRSTVVAAVLDRTRAKVVGITGALRRAGTATAVIGARVIGRRTRPVTAQAVLLRARATRAVGAAAALRRAALARATVMGASLWPSSKIRMAAVLRRVVARPTTMAGLLTRTRQAATVIGGVVQLRRRTATLGTAARLTAHRVRTTVVAARLLRTVTNPTVVGAYLTHRLARSVTQAALLARRGVELWTRLTGVRLARPTRQVGMRAVKIRRAIPATIAAGARLTVRSTRSTVVGAYTAVPHALDAAMAATLHRIGTPTVRATAALGRTVTGATTAGARLFRRGTAAVTGSGVVRRRGTALTVGTGAVVLRLRSRVVAFAGTLFRADVQQVTTILARIVHIEHLGVRMRAQVRGTPRAIVEAGAVLRGGYLSLRTGAHLLGTLLLHSRLTAGTSKEGNIRSTSVGARVVLRGVRAFGVRARIAYIQHTTVAGSGVLSKVRVVAPRMAAHLRHTLVVTVAMRAFLISRNAVQSTMGAVLSSHGRRVTLLPNAVLRAVKERSVVMRGALLRLQASRSTTLSVLVQRRDIAVTSTMNAMVAGRHTLHVGLRAMTLRLGRLATTMSASVRGTGQPPVTMAAVLTRHRVAMITLIRGTVSRTWTARTTVGGLLRAVGLTRAVGVQARVSRRYEITIGTGAVLKARLGLALAAAAVLARTAGSAVARRLNMTARLIPQGAVRSESLAAEIGAPQPRLEVGVGQAEVSALTIGVADRGAPRLLVTLGAPEGS